MQVIVKDVPEPVLEAVRADAEQRDVAVRALVVQRLSEHFSVPVTDRKPRRYSAPTTSDLHLEMSRELRGSLRAAAFETEGTIRGVVCAALAKRYKLPAVPIGRRSRRG